MMKIAVFCSGNGTNLQAIIDAASSGAIKNAEISLVVSDNPQAFALERAKKANIETFLVEKKNFPSQEEYEKTILKKLTERQIELLVLAGYMKLVGKTLLGAYKNKILNIHPALLPSFKGTHGIDDSFQYGVKVTGPTVHLVDENVDHGPIILQEAVPVAEDDTLESLTQKIHAAEHRIYPEAIRLFVEGKLKIIGRRVKILSIILLAATVFFNFAGAEEKEIALIPRPDYSYYECWEMDYSDDNRVSVIRMLKDKTEPPLEKGEMLTNRERLNKKMDLYFQAVSTTGEIFDSLKMPYISRGIDNLISWSRSVKGYTENFEEKLEKNYKLHLEMEGDDPYLIFRHNY